MTARIVQLIARYVGVGLASLGTYLFGTEWAAAQADKINNFSAAAAALAVGVVSLFVSEVIHRALTGSFLASPGTPKPQDKPLVNKSGYNPALGLAGLGALLALSVQGVGCAGPGALRASEYDGVAQRTLDYVDSRAPFDPALTDAQRRETLFDSALLRGGFDAAMGRPRASTAFERLYPAPAPGPAPGPTPAPAPIGPPAPPGAGDPGGPGGG